MRFLSQPFRRWWHPKPMTWLLLMVAAAVVAAAPTFVIRWDWRDELFDFLGLYFIIAGTLLALVGRAPEQEESQMVLPLLAGVFAVCRRPWQRSFLWAAAAAWPLLMALSRVYTGRYYLTDVLGGLLLGTAWVCCSTGLLLSLVQAGFGQQRLSQTIERDLA